jgi:hypothetical protein
MQVALWGEHGAGQSGGPMTRDEKLAALNLRRAKKKLPPLTEEQAAANEREFLARMEAERRGRKP